MNTFTQQIPNYAEIEFQKELSVWLNNKNTDNEAALKSWLAGLTVSSGTGLDSNLISAMATDRASKETDTIEN